MKLLGVLSRNIYTIHTNRKRSYEVKYLKNNLLKNYIFTIPCFLTSPSVPLQKERRVIHPKIKILGVNISTP